MNSIIALLIFGIALVLTITPAVALVIAIILGGQFPDGSSGCDFCDSDMETRLGGGDVACSDCKRQRL